MKFDHMERRRLTKWHKQGKKNKHAQTGFEEAEKRKRGGRKHTQWGGDGENTKEWHRNVKGGDGETHKLRTEKCIKRERTSKQEGRNLQ